MADQPAHALALHRSPSDTFRRQGNQVKGLAKPQTKRLARRGWLDTVAGTVKQRAAKVLFQKRNLL